MKKADDSTAELSSSAADNEDAKLHRKGFMQVARHPLVRLIAQTYIILRRLNKM
jgi:hypothetical protein